MVASVAASSSSETPFAYTPEERAAMIEGNLWMVQFAVRKLSEVCSAAMMDKEDAIAYGVEGLIKAVDNFDPSRGNTFATYGLLRIRGAILDAARASDTLPRPLRKRLRDIETASTELSHKLGRTPTVKEIALYTEQPINVVRSTLDHRGTRVVSLDGASQSEGSETSVTLNIEDTDDYNNPVEMVDRAETTKLLHSAIRSLPDRDRQLVEMRYMKSMPYMQIASVMNLSESRVCQLHKRILQNLHRCLKADLDAA